MKALQHLGEVMVEGGHKMQVKIIKDVKETIIEIFVDGKKVEEVVTEPDFALEENKSFGDRKFSLRFLLNYNSMYDITL